MILEVKRKIVHLLLGIFLILLLYYDMVDKLVIVITTLIAFLILYLSTKIRIGFIEWLLDNLDRPHTRRIFPGRGPLFYLIGCSLALIIFSKEVAMASIVILAIGDSIPNIVGIKYAKIRRPFSDKKYLEGALVGFVLSFAAATIFVSWYEAFFSSLVAIFLEGIDMRIGLEKIDDNLIVPLSAGLVISLFRLIF